MRKIKEKEEILSLRVSLGNDALNVVRLINHLKGQMTKEELMRFVLRSAGVIILLLLCVTVAPAQSACPDYQACLTWDNPTVDVAGGTLPPNSLTANAVYVGTTSGGPYPVKIPLGVTSTYNFNLPANQPAGTYYFVVTASTINGESAYSNQASKALKPPVSSSCGNLKAQ